MRIAITGGTGSLGSALIEALRARPTTAAVLPQATSLDEIFEARTHAVDGVVVVSRDEVKSGDLADRHADWAPLKCVLGDVRDEARMREVFRGCDVVIHAAALKRISHSVYSPGEMVKTNVLGTMSVVNAAIEVGVGRVVVVSSDKAVEPTNLYGATKSCAETYAVQSNSYAVPRGTRVSCVRYGNVLGSRGSVVGVWRAALRAGRPLELTDERMTRFVITLPQAASFVLGALDRMEGGEIFVPRLPAAKMIDLAEALWFESRPGGDRSAGRRYARVVQVGLRPGGEKLHESMLSREEPPRSRWYVYNSGAVVFPSHHSWRATWPTPVGTYPVTNPYSSDAPCRWLGVDELVEMLRGVE